MAFRFRRTKSLMPGVRANVSKRGASVSFGPKGMKKTVGTSGSRTTVGLPGTGIHYTKAHRAGRDSSGSNWIVNIIAWMVGLGLLIWLFG